jgi:hypothetical protein
MKRAKNMDAEHSIFRILGQLLAACLLVHLVGHTHAGVVKAQYKEDVKIYCGNIDSLNLNLQAKSDINDIVDDDNLQGQQEPDIDLWKGVKFYRVQENETELVSEFESDDEKYAMNPKSNVLTIKSLSWFNFINGKKPRFFLP